MSVELAYIAEVDDLLVTIQPPRDGIHSDLWPSGLSVRRDVETNEIIGWEWIGFKRYWERNGNHVMARPIIEDAVTDQLWREADVLVPDDHPFVGYLRGITKNTEGA